MRCPWLLAPIVVAVSLAGVLIAPQLPDPSPVHWDAAGTPDGFGSPWLSAMLPPALAALTVVGMWWLPRIDRRRTVGAQLTGGECLIMAALVLFCAALQGITLGHAAFNCGLHELLVHDHIGALWSVIFAADHLHPLLSDDHHGAVEPIIRPQHGGRAFIPAELDVLVVGEGDFRPRGLDDGHVVRRRQELVEVAPLRVPTMLTAQSLEPK